MDQSVCIVGGGIAGAGAALALPEGLRATVFESRRVGGRLAVRRRDEGVYDHGASHLRLPDAAIRELVTDAVGETIVEIDGPVKQFDAEGTITDRSDEYVRYSGHNGIDTIVRALFEESGARLEEGTLVTQLRRQGQEWVVTAGGEDRQFSAVILATPAASAAVLLEGADWDGEIRRDLASVAGNIPHRTIDVVALHYPFELDIDCYGLVSVERASDVVWLAREECKPGHVPPGESLLILQLGTLWSAANADATPQETAIESAHYAGSLLGDDRIREPDWWAHHCWGQAIPAGEPAVNPFERALEFDLALAGDWVTGVGQAHAALESGIDAGRQVSERFGRPAKI